MSMASMRYVGEDPTTDQIVYPAATMGVVYDARAHVQRFVQGGHADEVVSLAVHPSGRFVATGEVGAGGAPKVVVWDALAAANDPALATGGAKNGKRSGVAGYARTVVTVIKGLHVGAVSHVAFSPDGLLLATIGEDRDHTLAVYDWLDGKGRLEYSSPTHRGQVLDLRYCSDDCLVSCGESRRTPTRTGPTIPHLDA